ncbi:TetR family transcriptional regulator [Actinoplanes sp. NPDC026619]|uniref:TetR/AcrR family transcriptional regulator n=1 Tax=Actinoplanes sp. NPDC026619 TaxID=3155798 RepID=UPI003406BD8C
MSGEPSAQAVQPERRRRNAAQTRQLLMHKARVRFIRDGYAATTVRDIADDAGVNVALINRYFTSKEGLFEACLGMAVNDIRSNTENVTLEQITERIVKRLAGDTDDARLQDSLMLLLRTSGDERVNDMRREILEAVSEKLAAAGGAPVDDQRLLRAQVVLSTAIGITLLRSSLRLTPIASADEQDLIGPLTDVVNALLPR